jgi:hypothetical protein
MTVVGVTTDRHAVVSGLFKLFDTSGLPLDTIFLLCVEKGFMPSWIDFYAEARMSGWAHKTIINRLSNSISDVYGNDFRDVVISRLCYLYGEKNVDTHA